MELDEERPCQLPQCSSDSWWPRAGSLWGHSTAYGKGGDYSLLSAMNPTFVTAFNQQHHARTSYLLVQLSAKLKIKNFKMVLANQQTKCGALREHTDCTPMKPALNHILGECCYHQWTDEGMRPREATWLVWSCWANEGHKPYSNQACWTQKIAVCLQSWAAKPLNFSTPSSWANGANPLQ